MDNSYVVIQRCALFRDIHRVFILFDKTRQRIAGKSFKISLLRLILGAFLLVCIAPPLLQPSYAQSRTDEEIPNEFIFRVLLMPNWTINDAIFAYELNGKYYLPISALSQGFEFFTEVQIDEQFAQGFASTEDNSFTLDGKRQELIMGGERQSLPEDAVLVSDYIENDDLYVQLEVLNQIWPIDLRVDLPNITIQVTAEEELSFMRDKEREDRRLQAKNRSEERRKSREKLPFRDNSYDLLGKPVIDYQAIYTYDTKDDELRGSNIFTGVQHIGRLIADYSANFQLQEDGQFRRPESVRLKFSRRAFGEDYLLVPTVKSFEAGDVTLRQRDLISSTVTGRGISISNDNQERDAEFDRITIEGIGPPGWDIELFNNDEFIAFNVVPDDGQYFFEDVILNFGNNEIKILFFGPQGQVREETRSYNAGGNMLTPGEFLYRLGASDSDRSFILLDNEPRLSPRGLTTTGFASYGLNTKTTLFGSYTAVPESTEDKSYVTAGAALDTAAGLVEAEAYKEIGGGQAVSVDYITKFLGFRSNLMVALFDDFESQDAGFGGNQKTFETQAQINRNVSLFGIPLGLRINALHTERKDTASSSNLTFTQTYSRSGIRLTHNLNSRLIDSSHDNTSGAFTTTVREGPWQFRGGLNYNLSPDTELASANGEIRYKTKDKFQAAYNVSHNFLTSDYSTGTQIGYDFDKFLGSFDADYRRDNGFTFTMRATTSLHPYGLNDALAGYDFSSSSRRNYAPVKANVFLDKDADGAFDIDVDEPIPDVHLNIGGGRSRTQSDETGLLIANAPDGGRTNISVDQRSLTDPYFVPGGKGFSTNPIKGKMITANFPVVETGAIEGTAYRTDNNKSVSGLTVNLIDAATHETLASVATGFDGYYSFEFIRPGTYILRADLSHEVETLSNETSLTPDELFIYGHDIYIRIPGTEEPYGPPTRDQYATLMQAQEVEENSAPPLDDPLSDDIDPVDLLDVQPEAGEEPPFRQEPFGPPAPIAEPPPLQE